MGLRCCSHITSAKIRGSWPPPPPPVSNGQHLAYPPLPPSSAIGSIWLPPSSAFVSICPMPLLYYNFFTLTCLHDKMENFHLSWSICLVGRLTTNYCAFATEDTNYQTASDSWSRVASYAVDLVTIKKQNLNQSTFR